MFSPSYAEQAARGIFIFHPDLDPDACPSYDVDAIVEPAAPIRQKRKPNMSKRFQSGSVRLLGDTWKGRYWQDDPAGNKRKHPQVDLGTRPQMTKMEAKRKLADIIDGLGLNKSNYVERLGVSAVTFTQVCDAWEKKKLPTLALSSRTELPGQLAMHLRPFFGAMPVETIKTGIVNDWINGLDKQGLHAKTVHNKWKMFRAIMNWHTDQNDESRRKWSPDLPHIPDMEQRWLTPSEMLQIIDVVREYPAHGQVEGQYKPLMRLDAFTGLRSGEVQGLHVEDFDFERGILHVQRSIYKSQEVPTKGKRRRYVFVDSVTLQMVKEFLGGRTTGRLFNSRLGTAFCNQQLNTVLRWATKRLELKAATMHSFRHGRISLLDSLGVSTKVVQDQVGHQNKRTTLKYTHKEESELRDMMDRIGVSCTQKPTLYTNQVSGSSSQQSS